MRKFMGLQDEMAVTAAGRAIESAGLADRISGERTGLYVAVGHIPFEAEDLKALKTASAPDGVLSMRAFSSDGFNAVNPLLTFRCLPNMPAFHVSSAFDIQGPCFVTYPGAGQFCVALERAASSLAAGEVDVAVVLGVANQRNALVEHHFRRLDDPVDAADLTDEAGAIVLERGATDRARATLESREIRYLPHDPFGSPPEHDPGTGGAADPPVELARAIEAGGSPIEQRISTRDGIVAALGWGPA
jgi:hypothetical protein